MKSETQMNARHDCISAFFPFSLVCQRPSIWIHSFVRTLKYDLPLLTAMVCLVFHPPSIYTSKEASSNIYSCSVPMNPSQCYDNDFNNNSTFLLMTTTLALKTASASGACGESLKTASA